jgi:hypothetical protein
MLHNNVFEKLYNSFNEKKSWLWIIVTISLGLQISIVFVVDASFHLLVASIACCSILYNVIFLNVHCAYKEWITFVLYWKSKKIQDALCFAYFPLSLVDGVIVVIYSHDFYCKSYDLQWSTNYQKFLETQYICL